MSPQLPTVLLRAQTDERLVRLSALGSERAFEAIVERYRKPLMGYARRMVGESRAEDVVQSAFVSAWGRISDGTEVRDLRAWLFRIVHNGSINVLKRASARDVELFEDTPALIDLHGEVERREDVRHTLDGIASLPAQQREALLGVAVQGRRHRDVGADLGVTDGAVRMLLHRARSNMRTAATALTPWPLLAWLSGERGAEVAAGGAGAGMMAGGALKAAALFSTAAVALSAGPQIAGHIGTSASARDDRVAPASGQQAAVRAADAGPLASLLSAPVVSAPRHRAAVRVTPEPQATTETAAPVATVAPAPTPATAPQPAPAAGVVEQQDESTTLPPRQVHKQVVRPAHEDEDEEISVEEEPPDLAAGERPIPPTGVPDDIAEAALPEAPAAAADEAELAAETDAAAGDKEASASASASAPAVPAPPAATLVAEPAAAPAP